MVGVLPNWIHQLLTKPLHSAFNDEIPAIVDVFSFSPVRRCCRLATGEYLESHADDRYAIRWGRGFYRTVELTLMMAA